MEKTKQRLEKVVTIYKKIGMTPLEAIQAYKLKHPEYKDAKMAYAGRLDPMAEGLILVVVNNENKKIMKYISNEKEYQAQILFGFETDTYDVLGIAKKAKEQGIDLDELKELVKGMPGQYDQKLPGYSSYNYKGKPLFWYARNNKLPKKMPVNRIVVKEAKINSIEEIEEGIILKRILKKINSVKGDFRQGFIETTWQKILSPRKKNKYYVLDITIKCSSGTYIRSIANDLGNLLESKAILFNLIRTKIGKYNFKKAEKV